MEFITAYGPKIQVKAECDKDGLTKQDMKDDCDINVIMKRYEKTGMVDHVSRYQGQYGDFEAMEFHEAMNFVIEAQDMFMSLPSKIRARFGNDPGAFLEFVNDENNTDELRKMGLLKPQAPGAPTSGPKGEETPPAEPAASGPDKGQETPPKGGPDRTS